jgi:hypothetical protein
MSDLYEHDFFGWTNLQAQLLREGRLSEADLDHIAEEIEDVGRNRVTELRNRLTVLLLHLLKWDFQPGFRSRSWRSMVSEQRERIVEHLADNPSLRPVLADAVTAGYRYALQRVDRETGMPKTAFPQSCPYDTAQILDPAFLPGEI